MIELEKCVLAKLVRMFRPHEGKFLGHDEVIDGPNDRSIVGFENSFPKQWLMEDFGFTEDEAAWLIAAVRKAAKEKTP